VSAEQPGHVAHHNVAVLTAEDGTTMDAMLGRAEIRALVWKRLDERHAVVDSERLQLLISRLKTLGHAPRFSDTLPE